MNPLETYLTQISQIAATGGGTGEESFYGALETLLNEAGDLLHPRVRCVSQLGNVGAGEPDFGFYSSDQFQQWKDSRPLEGQLPERGVAEVKGWNGNLAEIVGGEQVLRYGKKFGLVLVTNYREFLLVGQDAAGNQAVLEEFRLAGNEEDFRALLAQPRKAARASGDRVMQFLARALAYKAPLTTPEDLAWLLASYAREAKGRLEDCSDLENLQALRQALEEVLGLHFEGEKGIHFFQATLVQTLFYGVFSAWVLWAQGRPAPGERFNWREAGWSLHVPMIASLFSQIATPQKLKPLRIDEVLDLAGTALHRVDRGAFFSRFEEEYAVQYFYEPFLQAYDPELRKDLGVWYTPPEIVKYQVERVDRALREELGIKAGLADERVVVLDPCCGTGAYLVEVLRRIYRTMEESGVDALSVQRLKNAAMQRVIGFEIIPAPFVVSHLQIGLFLRLHGVPMREEKGERAAIFLTNALTGWDPPEEPKSALPLFPELVEERDAARKIKCEAPILVVLGNPPYNAFAGTSPEEEGGLVEPYKENLNVPLAAGGWGIRKFNLDDLYIRFFRIAERRIVKTGKGIVSFISNFSYLSEPSFVVMRQHLLQEFDGLWFDCMNGDSRETGKLTPDGKPDPSVFSTEHNREGIRKGTAVCVLVRKAGKKERQTVRFRNFWGKEKRKYLLASLQSSSIETGYQETTPDFLSRFSFKPLTLTPDYFRWPLVTEFSKEHHNGPVERRGFALISIDKDPLIQRISLYFNVDIPDSVVEQTYSSLMMTGNRIHGPLARRKLLRESRFDDAKLKRLPFKPFDIRWCYLDNIRPLYSEPSPRLLELKEIPANAFFITRDTADKFPEGPPFFYSNHICDYDCISGHARHFPVWIQKRAPDTNGWQNGDLFETGNEIGATLPNLTDQAKDYLRALSFSRQPKGTVDPSHIWLHTLAIGYSPRYLSENADGIRQNWPRLPLPASKEQFLASTALGKQLVELLDSENDIDGVSSGDPLQGLCGLAKISRAGGGALDPSEGHLALTAGWGYQGRGNVCMPGSGRVVAREAPDDRQKELFGPDAVDVYLNEHAYWANIPRIVWDYYIGGYQVIKKWLSYREERVLGRSLTLEEAAYVTEMVRRIAAIILLQPELDANYEAVKAHTYPWPGK